MKKVNNFKLDLLKPASVFCDSVEAIDWAYDSGLNRNTVIKTSSPALIWKKDVFRLDSKWDVDQMKQFQSTIGQLSRDIFDSIIKISEVSHEEALCISSVVVDFQKILFKASCLTIDDIKKPVLFIKVDGYGGPNGNNMNSPWDRILKDNKMLEVVTYKLKKQHYDNITHSQWLYRYKIAGIETLIYRLFFKLSSFLPKKIYNKKVYIYRENELVIETAANLILRGISIEKLKPKGKSKLEKSQAFFLIKKSISPIIKKRIENYVIPDLVDRCEKIFFENLKEQINLFYEYRSIWRNSIEHIKAENGVLLTNHPSSLHGFSITSLCKENKVPVISAQHGITPEISKYHDEVEVAIDSNTSDCTLVYNRQSANTCDSSHFSRGESFVSGISLRHLRMSSVKMPLDKDYPIVYISTNIYKGNFGFFIGSLTDYDRSIKEKDLIEKVFAKLPCNIRYKTYPEENKRYPDIDPVFDVINCFNNIELFTDKIDMRYLIAKHRILITSRATSTLGWAIFSKKPVIFINWKENNPLTEDAEEFFDRGLFLFNDNDKDFHKELLKFLLKPISEIERLWDIKEKYRKEMIMEFFSAYNSKSGERASKMIINNFLM